MQQIKKSDQRNGDTSQLGDPVEIGYTKVDNPQKKLPIVDANDKECYCKIVRTERTQGIHNRFFVKGKIDNRLVDPWDDTDLQRNGRYAASIGRDPYKWIEVTKLGFDLYMLFLQGRSPANFDRATRETINA